MGIRYMLTVCPAQGPIVNNDNGNDDDDDNANSQTIRWTNIPGDFKSIADPSVDWNNITEV
jgi:hypothetical protein